MAVKPGFGTLFASASAGNEHAQTELHRRYLPLVMHRLRQRSRGGLRRTHDTTDLAQSVFQDVLRDLGRIEDRGERAFRNLLRLKAENKVRSKFRKRLCPRGGWRETSLPDDMDRLDHSPGPATQLRHQEDAARVRESMRRLKPTYRAIILLRQDANRTYAEVAAHLGLSSPDAARMQHARALLALRAQWDATQTT